MCAVSVNATTQLGKQSQDCTPPSSTMQRFFSATITQGQKIRIHLVRQGQFVKSGQGLWERDCNCCN